MKKLTITILIILAFCLAALAADGDLDTSFDSDGKVTTDFFGNVDGGLATAIQPDGKIVVAGYAFNESTYNDFAVARYNPNGSLDTAFGTNGLVTTDFFGSDDIGNAMAILADGKILVAGQAYNGSNPEFGVARYNTNGSLDTSFGTGGKATTDFSNFDDLGFATAIQADGKIIVAGYSDNGSSSDFTIVRYNADGSLDTSFGTGGNVMTDFFGSYDYGYAATIQADGKIIVAGAADNGSHFDFAVARYNTDGSLDTSFDSDGKVTTDFFGSTDSITAMTIQSDGKIIVTGVAQNESILDFALARYNADGSLDTSFGTNGKVTTDFGSFDAGSEITIQADGKIIVAGAAYNGSHFDFALARYNTDGSLDTSFGTNGKTTTDFFGDYDYGFAVAVQSDGNIVVAGESLNGSNYDMAIARYSVATDSDGDGVLDADDLCPGTVLPESAPLQLKKNRYYADKGGYFIDSEETWSGITVADTGGCSASQIIEAAGLGEGHQRFGLTRSALLDWILAH